MTRLPQGDRYTAVAIVLHWAIAAAIVFNLALGWWMGEAIDDPGWAALAITGFQLHKSVGLTVLALSVLRLAWRLAHRPPPLPPHMRPWEQWTARSVHWVFYGLMVALPLSGWLYASTQWRESGPLAVPTLWFGRFEVPHLLGLNELPARSRAGAAAGLGGLHESLAWLMAGLLVVHIAAAVKHRFVWRDTVVAGMAPGSGLAVAVLTVAAITTAGLLPPRSSGPVPDIRGSAAGWAVDPASEIAFSGVYAGEPFRGRFTRWQADLRFNPFAARLITVAATVETGSATDGVPLHDGTLPEREWFDVERHPLARFAATRIGPKSGGGLAVEGALTLKDRVLPVPPLDLVVSEDAIQISGRFEIDRADADLGMESDPAGEFVSRRIVVEVRILARPPS